MRYWAHIDSEGEVISVIVADLDFINLQASPESYIEYFLDGLKRGKVAGVGDMYDKEKDIFISKQNYLTIVCQRDNYGASNFEG